MTATGLFHEGDPTRLSSRVSAGGLAVIIAIAAGEAVVAHAPVLLSGRRLFFHLARANALCAALTAAPRATAVLTLAEAYVSPDWYAAADQVPTWNYASVEMAGPTRLLDDRETGERLGDLSLHFERRLLPKLPWSPAKMSPGRFEAMVRGVTGFEMRVERFEGVSKLSQNKTPDEVSRVAGQLSGASEAGARIARLMREMLVSPEIPPPA